MISICIPIYNFDVTNLVTELHKQACELNVPFEIVLLDDASQEEWKQINRSLTDLSKVYYIELAQNTGRSKIRNLLAQKAQYPYLIFMDCDMMVVKGDFLRNYLNICKEGIVCSGGRTYPAEPQDAKYILHWTLGVNREVQDAAFRNKHPNRRFLTNNFLIDREILLRLKFDERLVGYGYEDILFGYELSKLNIRIQHIDNPLCHIGLDATPVLLEKMQHSLHNLHLISNFTRQDPQFAQTVKILCVFRFLNKWKLTRMMASLFRKFQHPLERNLYSEKPSLLLFDLYRLAYLCHIHHG